MFRCHGIPKLNNVCTVQLQYNKTLFLVSKRLRYGKLYFALIGAFLIQITTVSYDSCTVKPPYGLITRKQSPSVSDHFGELHFEWSLTGGSVFWPVNTLLAVPFQLVERASESRKRARRDWSFETVASELAEGKLGERWEKTAANLVSRAFAAFKMAGRENKPEGEAAKTLCKT